MIKWDGLSTTEIAPQFSQAQTWNELSARLEAQPKRRVIPVVWLYAAATIAGIVIGGFSIHYLDKSTRREPFTAGITKLQPPVLKTPAVITTVVLTAPKDGLTSKKNDDYLQRNSTHHSSPEKDTQHTVTLQKPDTKQASDSLPAITDETATTAAKPLPAQRAIHLLDIESEDRTVLTDQPAGIHNSRSFTIYISPSRLPDGKDAHAPSSVLRPFFR